MFSIIIPNYNGDKYLTSCLGSILSSTYENFELIIIDNNSTDGSLKLLDRFRNDKRIKIVPLANNIGYALANNLGIKNSKGDFLVFLNNDTCVDSQWLTELLKIFNIDHSVAAVQCMLLNMLEPGIYSLGGSLDYSGRFVPIECLWHSSPALKAQKRLFWGSGAALVVRRSVLEKTGGFDSELPNDEVDLCWRINLLGGRILLAPKAIVYHVGSGSFGKKLNAKRIYYSERSMLTSCFRNFGFRSLTCSYVYLLSYLPMAIALDIIFRKRIDVLLNRANAYLQFLVNFRKIYSQRLFVQNNIRKITDTEIRKLMIKPNPFLLQRYSQKRSLSN